MQFTDTEIVRIGIHQIVEARNQFSHSRFATGKIKRSQWMARILDLHVVIVAVALAFGTLAGIMSQTKKQAS